MRLYLASSFTRADDVELLATTLEGEGHEIPDLWWTQRFIDLDCGINSDSDWHGQPVARAVEARHWRTIREADAVVLVGNMATGGTRQRFSGANVEVGYALAIGKPVIIVGAVKRTPMYASCIHVSGQKELLRVLAIFDQENPTAELVAEGLFVPSGIESITMNSEHDELEPSTESGGRIQ